MAKATTKARSKFLLEIGVEEIPDWMIVPALAHLKKAFADKLAENRLEGEVEWADATARRLALFVNWLPKGQADSVETISGPPKAAGEGAAQGFARKLGVTPEQLETMSTPKGEYFSYKKSVPGRPTIDILAEILPQLILGIPWPKTMFWTVKGGSRFIRPIRWVLALFDTDVVPFEVAGVKSGNTTSGHRRFGKSGFKVTISNYEARLLANHVILRAADRRQRILDGITAVVPEGMRVKADESLLDTLTYLTEFPTPILGGFDPSYLSLPAEVLVTVMRHHQKNFSVEAADGSLAPHFVAVMNVPGDPEGFVRSGNERVLRARFNDARFFFDVDQKRKLADRVDDLRAVTYQKQLADQASYWHKTQRNVALTAELGGNANAQRAALLAKCDLTNEMVKEFTELQGVVGGLYCRAQGEPEEVATAVYDHYKPVSMEDSVPRTESGQIVALADKLDTLKECFRIGLAPTGSKDPFALRRAAQGVLKVLIEGQIDKPLVPLLGGDKTLVDFFEDRVRYYFREVRGYRYDEVNAAMAPGWSDLKDLARRLEALSAVRPTENFEPLAASFKRIRNILKQSNFAGGPFTETLLEVGPERELFEASNALQLSGSDYRSDLALIGTLRPHVDLFFDKVLVNAQDPAVRANRLALLDGMLTKFSKIADFSEIATA